MNLDAVKRQLIHDEGLRLKKYKDSEGIWTVLVGHNMEAKPLPAEMQARLEANGALTEEDAEVVLLRDIADHVQALDTRLPWWTKLDEARQDALVNMCFNMGIGQENPPHGLLGFKNSLALLERGEYEKAAANLAMSKWAKQVGPRATRIIAVIKGASA